MSKPTRTTIGIAAFFFLMMGCQTQHRVETVHKVEVAPMHIIIDVNVKVDRALDDFFGDLDKAAEDVQTPSQ
jgi:hypothetical protein